MADLDAHLDQDALAVGFLGICTDHDHRIDFAEFFAWWEEQSGLGYPPQHAR
jgi:hypothetical protein